MTRAQEIAKAGDRAGAIKAAEVEGAAAWSSDNGRAVDCPYLPVDGAPDDWLLRQAWMRGYYRKHPRSNAEWGRVA